MASLWYATYKEWGGWEISGRFKRSSRPAAARASAHRCQVQRVRVRTEPSKLVRMDVSHQVCWVKFNPESDTGLAAKIMIPAVPKSTFSPGMSAPHCDARRERSDSSCSFSASEAGTATMVLNRK